MKKILSSTLILGFVLFSTILQAHADEVILKNGKPFVLSNGKEIHLEYASLAFIKELNLYVLGVDEDESLHNLESGIHFFKQGQEKPFVFKPNFVGSALSGDYAISPDKRKLALNLALTTSGSWYFFSIPDLKLLDKVEYFSIKNKLPIWVDMDGKVGVLVNQSSAQQNIEASRKCEYDPCNASSVAFYDFTTKKNITLFEGTELCDYMLMGFENGEVLVDAICTQKAEEWNHFPMKYAPKRIRKKLSDI